MVAKCSHVLEGCDGTVKFFLNLCCLLSPTAEAWLLLGTHNGKGHRRNALLLGVDASMFLLCLHSTTITIYCQCVFTFNYHDYYCQCLFTFNYHDYLVSMCVYI